jgi:hypothetical protein
MLEVPVESVAPDPSASASSASVVASKPVAPVPGLFDDLLDGIDTEDPEFKRGVAEMKADMLRKAAERQANFKRREEERMLADKRQRTE